MEITNSPIDESANKPDENQRDPARERRLMLDQIMQLPLWGEDELALILDVKIDSVRHMKARGEIPGIVNLNLRKWFIHRDAFLEHIKQRGMPKAPPGRPRGSKAADDQ